MPTPNFVPRTINVVDNDLKIRSQLPRIDRVRDLPPIQGVDCSQNGPEMVLIPYRVVCKWSGNRLEIDLMRRLNCSSYVGNRLWSLSPAVLSKTYLFSPYWSAEAAAGPAFSPAGFPAIQEARQYFFNPNSFSCSHPAVGRDYRAVLSCQKRSRQIIYEKYCLFMPVICKLCNNNMPTQSTISL